MSDETQPIVTSTADKDQARRSSAAYGSRQGGILAVLGFEHLELDRDGVEWRHPSGAVLFRGEADGMEEKELVTLLHLRALGLGRMEVQREIMCALGLEYATGR